ncbi:MAG: hypothetical protein ACXACI_07140 [Candidatus Hodarchaeales archaeon]|jgi:hypothetical protein
MGDFSITDVYVVNTAGISLFHRDYTGPQPVNKATGEDDQLLTGLISAIFMLAKQMGRENIRSMTMGEQNFFYEVSGELIYILGVQSDFPEVVAQEILSKVKNTFLNYYSTLSRAQAMDSDSYEELGAPFDAILEQARAPSAHRSAADKIEEMQTFLEDIMGSAGPELLQTHLKTKKFRKLETKEDWENLLSAFLTDLSVIMDEGQAQQLIEELKGMVLNEN